jgi:predicted acyl esterase
VSAPLRRDLVIAGPSSLDLYLKSSVRNTDVQVTISEVRPGGNETYVQNGWLRASQRKLNRRRSTVLNPYPTHLKRDAALLPWGRFALVRVPVFPVAHAFRAGSRLRVTIEAPGGDRPRWDFDTIDRGRSRTTVALGGSRPSSLVLPVIRGATAKGTPLPGPTALRGQPSRRYSPASNGG